MVDWNVAIKFDILLITCFRNNSYLFFKKSYFALMQFGDAQLHLIHEKFDVILDYLVLIFPWWHLLALNLVPIHLPKILSLSMLQKISLNILSFLYSIKNHYIFSCKIIMCAWGVSKIKWKTYYLIKIKISRFKISTKHIIKLWNVECFCFNK